ncbi:MAG: single-stranded DNA-binding protein [Clostridia bacterium]|nr:single-stranded DNA-binding protein [Clostridia bacterium]
MADLNKVILMGHMTADPELKQTTSGISVCSFSIGVNRRYSKADQGQQSVDFINIVAWRQQAEFVSRYFKKGSSIIVCGSIQVRSWNDQNGQKRYATEVVADEVSFGAPAASSQAGGDRPQGGAQGYTPSAYGAPSYSTGSADFEEIPGDESLPF